MRTLCRAACVSAPWRCSLRAPARRCRVLVAAAGLGRGGARLRARSLRARDRLLRHLARKLLRLAGRRVATWEPLRPGPAFPGLLRDRARRGPEPSRPALGGARGRARRRPRRPQRRPRRDLDGRCCARSKPSRRARSPSRPGEPRLLAVGGDDGVRLSARRRQDLGADGRGRSGPPAGRVAGLRSRRPPRPLRRHVAPGVPHARRRRDVEPDRRRHGSRRDRLRVGLRCGGLARHLGLDLRLGLPHARRRRPLDAIHDRVHQPPLARRPPRPEPAGRRLRRDGRRAPPLGRRRRDVGADLARVARRHGARSGPSAPDASTSARRARASSTPTTGAATLEPGSQRACRRAASRSSWPIPNDPDRVFFFRAFGGEESGVWEARGPAGAQASRVDPLPAAASLAAFRGADGKTVLLVASSSGVRVSRDGGVRWSASAEPPPRRADRSLRRALRRAGARHDGGCLPRRRRRRALRGRGGAACGRRVRRAARRPRRRSAPRGSIRRRPFRTGTAGAGRARRRRFSGAASSSRTPPRASRSAASSTCRRSTERSSGRRADRRRAFTSPRAGLALATAAQAPGGQGLRRDDGRRAVSLRAVRAGCRRQRQVLETFNTDPGLHCLRSSPSRPRSRAPRSRASPGRRSGTDRPCRAACRRETKSDLPAASIQIMSSGIIVFFIQKWCGAVSAKTKEHARSSRAGSRGTSGPAPAPRACSASSSR